MIELYILLFVISLLLAKYFILPYKTYLFYRKYGKGHFFPIFGELLKILESQSKHGDGDYLYQHIHDNQEENNKIYVCNHGSDVKLSLIDSEIVKEFYMKQQDCYVKDSFLISNIKRIFQDGLVFSEGEKWKSTRKIFSKAFHFDYLQGLSTSIQEIALKNFKKMISENQLGSVNTIDCMQAVTGSVIIQSFFGETLEDSKIENLSFTSALSHALSTLGKQTFSLPFFLLGKSFYTLGLTKDGQKFNSFLNKLKEFVGTHLDKKILEIEEEIKQTGKTTNKSILAQLITSKELEGISREQLQYEFTNFYLTGMDTTGHLLGMLVYYISQNKEIYQNLRKEIDENQDSSPSKLASLPYLNAVIKEGLRYYGPANLLFDRKAVKDHDLCGIPIKKGTVVAPYAMAIHRDSKHFEDPHRFNPSRWIGKPESDITPFSFIPFSAGARNCIGQHLAQLEARIILNLFMKTFDFSCPDDYILQMRHYFWGSPFDPLRIRLASRQ